MLSKSRFLVTAIIMSILLLSACNLPDRQATQTLTPTPTMVPLQKSTPTPTPTPMPLCSNQYFPSTIGDTWQYTGNNSATGDYNRTDTVTNSVSDSFSVHTTVSNVSYTLQYNCSSAGLMATDPVTQYAGALLNSPDIPVTVTLSSNAGITLPANIAPGDTWQQTADFEASAQSLNLKGRLVFDHTAVGYEAVTVPFGSFNALRVDTTIRVEVTALHVTAGTYTISTWMVSNIGVVKSQGTSHVSGIDFTDSMQLTSFSHKQ